MLLDLRTGIFDSQPAQSIRTLADLAPIFAESDDSLDLCQVVYEIHGSPAEVEGPARLLYATTVLHPGRVGREFFMTRGHFHTDPNRGELMFTLSGIGKLILMDRDAQVQLEPMTPGSVHDVDGRFAHRVVNDGLEPLVFLVAWMSDCGHDYATTQLPGLREAFRADALLGI